MVSAQWMLYKEGVVDRKDIQKWNEYNKKIFESKQKIYDNQSEQK